MAKYFQSPVGEFINTWISRPDTKFNADGLYHTDLAVDSSLEFTQLTIEKIRGAAQAAFDEETATMKPAEAKKYKLYLPFEDETDDEGEATGRTIFKFKQNAQIKTKDGKIKKVFIEIYDSKNNQLPENTPVFGGTVGRIMFSMRTINMSSSKEIGVRLDFSKAQIIELKSGGRGFDEVEDGYVHKGDNPKSTSQETDDEGGDY